MINIGKIETQFVVCSYKTTEIWDGKKNESGVILPWQVIGPNRYLIDKILGETEIEHSLGIKPHNSLQSSSNQKNMGNL